MKNLMKSLMLVAVAAMGFTACSKESFADVTPELEPMVKMTITAEDASRTYLDEANDKAQWSESGEYIKAYQLVGEFAEDNQTATFSTSSEGVITDGKASFGVAFAATEGTSFTYSAIYPASAGMDTDGEEDLDYVKLLTPAVQKPTATSFDGAADLMIAKTVVAEVQPTNLSLQFKRVIAVAKMSLTNLPTTDKLVNVTFEATDKVLAGRSAFNIAEGTVTEYGYNSPVAQITLDYAEAPIANTNPIYFTCLPVELAAGDSFTVTATTENNVKYTRTVTLADAQVLNFNEGKMSTFSVNMADAESESIASLEGEYAVMALANGTLHLMGNPSTSSTVYLTQTEIAGTAIPEEYAYTDGQFVWVVEKLDNGRYTLKQKSSGKYVFWSSGNSANLQTNAYELTIVKNDNGSFNITSATDATRNLRYNSSSPRFAFYASAQTAIYLVPAVMNTDPRISVASTAISIEAAGATDSTLAIGCENFDAAELSVAKQDGADWLTVSYDDAGTLTYSATANSGDKRTATVTLSADGAEDVVLTFTQKSPIIEKITVAEFIALADTSTYYELTGKVTNVANTEYGNFDLVDDSDSIYVYGLYSTDGTQNKYWASSGVKEGDTITIQGQYQLYNGTHEVVNARYISHVAAPEGGDEGEGGPTPGVVATAKSADIVTASSYAKYETSEWLITMGGNNKSLGANNNNKSKLVLNEKYVTATPLDSSITSTSTYYTALISKNKLENVNKIVLEGTTSGSYSGVGVTYSTDGNTWSKIADFGTNKTFTFETIGSAYYAIILKGTSNYRWDDMVATFSYE